MKRSLTQTVSAVVLGAIALTSCQNAATQFRPAGPNFAPRTVRAASTPSTQANNKVVVGYQGQLTQAKIQQLEQQHGLRFDRNIPQIGVAIFQGSSARQDFEALQSDPQITFAGPNESPRRIVEQPETVPHPRTGGKGDPMKDQQWSLKAVDAEKAWSMTTGAGATVAVVDTGVDLKHPDLEANLVEGYNAEQPGGSPQDGHYHGTHVAGIIAAVANNGVGVTGIAPQAKVIPVRAISRGGVAEVADGIVWATDHGARAINLSLGWDFPNQSTEETIKRAVKYAIDKNVVICAAMSNSSRYNPRSVPDNLANKPGFEGGVIGVGNVDVNDARNGAYGNWKDISSPGTKIMSTLPNERWGNLTGTSMATPMVTGIVALMVAQNPGLSNVEIKQQIMASAVDLGDAGKDDQFGAGRISAPGALGSTAMMQQMRALRSMRLR